MQVSERNHSSNESLADMPLFARPNDPITAPSAQSARLRSCREETLTREADERSVYQAAGVPVADAPAEAPKVEFYSHDGGRFEVSSNGVYFAKSNKEQRICSTLRVTAETSDEAGNNHGRLLKWQDNSGTQHTWAMPMTLTAGDGIEVRKELLSRGVTIEPGRDRLLLTYLTTVKPGARHVSVSRLGWHDARYCLPSVTLGEGAGNLAYQSEQAGASEFGQRGTVEAWRDGVAALSAGNSRLMFALSCAFAGPLVHLADVESGGFHLVGGSSTGKTTALKAAASVWGHPERFARTWRATANGLESVAVAHNDSLLILDELGQCDAKQAGEAAYMLANGKGKARASRTGGARAAAAWRVLFLSSGELKLSTLMEGDRKKANAGQELRLANIPIDASKGLGGFEDVHDSGTTALFAQRVKAAGEEAYGQVGVAWVRQLASDYGEVPKLMAAYVDAFVKEAVPPGASGQVERVARRFGLAAAAGELATDYGLTGWREYQARDAVALCFRAWLEDFGAGSHEDRAVCEQVRLFLERNGASRFQRLDDKSGERVPNRVGYFRDEGQEPNTTRQYLVPAATFKAEVIEGRDFKAATAALVSSGLLIRGKDKIAVKVRVPELGMKTVDLYCLAIPEEVTA